jgi:hypothetical protein
MAIETYELIIARIATTITPKKTKMPNPNISMATIGANTSGVEPL